MLEYEQIKHILGMINDPVEKLEMVMDLGKNLPPVPENAVCNEIVGCVSRVQICLGPNNHFYGIADSALVRGVLVIILSMVDEKTPDEIKKMPLGSMFAELNINLGASRLNGVNSMISFLENL